MTENHQGGVAVIVATHGGLAEELVATAAQIVGRETGLTPFAFNEGEAPKASFRRLRGMIGKAEKGRGVIILVDLFGGTPGSLALSMLDDTQVEVVTGVNLPMAIAAATLDLGHDLHTASATIVEVGVNSIKAAGRLLKK